MAAYTKEQRARAKAENLTLVSLCIEPSPNGGGMSFTGPATVEERAEIMEFMNGFLTRRVARLKAAKEVKSAAD